MLKKVLKKIKCIALDMDGTTNLGENQIGNMAETLSILRNSGKQLVFLTNNSSYSSNSLKEKCKRIGLFGECDVHYTSGLATIEYLKDKYPNKVCYVVGTPALLEEFEEHGISLSETNPDVAVLGYDTTVTYDKFVKLIRAVNNGATYIATHPDLFCPSEDVCLPDCGSFMKLIESSAGIKPQIIIGKPNQIMGKRIMENFGCNADEILMVGDRLSTDIQFGINCGFYTMLVMSGETDEKTLKNSDVVPDFVLDTLNDIVEYMED